MTFTRREALTLAVLSPAAIVHGTPPPSKGNPTPSGGQSPHGNSAEFPLLEYTIAGLQACMVSGEYTAVQITEQYLQRIESLDRRGPELHHVIECNPDALAIARTLDEDRKAGRIRGPMHGIPILLKDNIGTFDRMQTTAGSFALLDVRPARDAVIVSRLRAAGAIILGKANMTEWAAPRGTLSLAGWSARGGQGRNPYALDRSPSGSSSGPAAGVAANYCAAGIGTETGGSIVSPSSSNSVVGLRPTRGLLSRATIIPVSSSLDVPGPIARTVQDAAIVLDAMTGADERNPITAMSRSRGRYAMYTVDASLRAARIGVTREHLFGHHPRTDALINDAVDLMRHEGATIIDPADVPYDELDRAMPDLLAITSRDYLTDLPRYLRELPPNSPKCLADLIAFNLAHKELEMPYFGQEAWIALAGTQPVSLAKYAAALRRMRSLAREGGIDATMDRYRLDALIGPTLPPPGLIDTVNGDTGGFASPAMMPALAGYPHITVPAGYIDHLPVGISFFGRAWSEPKLLGLASAFELATRHRRPPRFLPSATS